MCAGAAALDGVYSLLEERSLSSLPAQDQAVCQSGCVYHRAGAGPGKEYCFRAGGATAQCSAVGEADSLLLQRSSLLEEVDLLTTSRTAKAEEVETRRGLGSTLDTALGQVAALAPAPRRRAREAAGCGPALLLAGNLTGALLAGNFEAAQAAALSLAAAPSTPCTAEQGLVLAAALPGLREAREGERAAVEVLEGELAAVEASLAQLAVEVEGLEASLAALGVTALEVAADPGQEVPLVLGPGEELGRGPGPQEELPLALAFPVIRLPALLRL